MDLYEIKSTGVFSASVTYCMFTHGRDGKEEMVLGVLLHCHRQWLEAKLDTSLVACLFAVFAEFCWTCSEVMDNVSVSKSSFAIVYHSNISLSGINLVEK